MVDLLKLKREKLVEKEDRKVQKHVNKNRSDNEKDTPPASC